MPSILRRRYRMARADLPNAVTVTNVSKTFKLPHTRHTGIKQVFVNFYKRRRGYERQQVLDTISFDIKEGEFFGIVGRNGSGKSTLLKLLAGIYTPDKGSAQIHGSLTPFIELGVGFNPELTGRENVFLNGALLGFNRKEMEDMYDDIVDFAELSRFMDQKLKNYSSGMQVRLAFSIAIRARSDILLLDEVLAVGDAIFQHKCFAYFKELKRRKQTVIFVSHDSSVLQEYCDRGILLEKGKIICEGDITKVVQEYADILNEHEAAQDTAEDAAVNDKHHWGSGEVLVTGGKALNAVSGRGQSIFTDKDETVGISVTYTAQQNVDQPVFGITIIEPTGQRVFESNTLRLHIKTKAMQAGETATYEWRVPNIFSSGDYSVTPAVADQFGSMIYDWRDEIVTFKIRKTVASNALTNVTHEIIRKD